MKRSTFVRRVAAAAAVSARALVAQSVPEINYDANADIISLPSYGEVAGVATNSRGHVFVYARTGHAVATLGDERTFYHGGSRLFQFDQTGKFVKEIGQGVYAVNFAQQVRVDPQDNIWIVDAGSNQVVKFDADGRFQMVLGRKPESIPLRPGPGVSATAADAAFVAARGPAAGGPGGGGGGGGGSAAARGRPPGAGINGDNFNRPSDVTWDRAGNIYVADGFGTNNRIAKFTKDGNFVKTLGPDRFRTRSVQPDPRHRERRGRQHLRRRRRQQTHPGVRRRRHVQVADHATSARRRRSAFPAASTQFLYSSNSNDSGEHGQRRDLQGPAERPGRRQVRQGRQDCRRSSAWSTRSTAGPRTICGSAKSGTGACRRSRSSDSGDR